jgi:hypothetical protein
VTLVTRPVFQTWYHLAAALVSAGVDESKAGEWAQAALNAPHPMLHLRKIYDDLEDVVEHNEKLRRGIARVIEANRGD